MRETLFEKKAVVITIVVALAIICGALIYGILVTPARQPYREALAQYKNVSRALSQTNVSLNATAASDEDFATNVSALNARLTALENENEALGKEAVLTKEEGKTLYDAYNVRIERFVAYNREVLASIEKVRPVLRDCSNAMTNVTEDEASAKVIRECATKMAAVKDVPNEDYKTLIESFASQYGELAAVLEATIALPDPEGAAKVRYSELVKRRSAIIQAFSDSGEKFSKDVQTHRNEVLTTDSEKALGDYLERKSRIF